MILRPWKFPALMKLSMMLWNLLKTTAMRSNPPFKTVYLLSWYESSHGFLTWHNTILKYGKNYPSITSYRIPFPFKDLTLFEFKTMKEEMEKCGIANHRWAPFRPTRSPARKTVQTRSNPHWRRQKKLSQCDRHRISANFPGPESLISFVSFDFRRIHKHRASCRDQYR